ncbi:hypothetical protein CKA32_006769 [Geitlerinema sp. FC II]|nr:hypothetical protein CKA32_006769 [Geitlerinema sp. FC II]
MARSKALTEGGFAAFIVLKRFVCGCPVRQLITLSVSFTANSEQRAVL